MEYLAHFTNGPFVMIQSNLEPSSKTTEDTYDKKQGLLHM